MVTEQRFVDPEGVVTRELPVPVDPDSGYWSTPAWAVDPQPGVYDMRFHATLPDGKTERTSIFVFYLPDATRQFAFIRDIDSDSGQPQLIVDYADFLGGEEAVQAAIEDGELPPDQADEGLPNGFYIRNQNPLPRTLSLDSGAPLYLFDLTVGDTFGFDDVTADGLVSIVEDRLESSYYGGVIDSPA